MYRKILVPLDGSPLAETILPHARTLARPEDAEIILLQVPLVPSSEFLSRDPSLTSNIISSIENESQTYLKKEVAKLKSEGANVSSITREGPVAETILAVAKEIRADAIAMCTHGRTGVQRLLMGSITEDVVRLSPIPVILLHPAPPHN